MSNDTPGPVPARGLAVSAPLTKWKNEPTVMDLQNDFQIAKPTHDMQVSKVKAWLNLRNVEGDAKPKKVANRSGVQPKLIRKQAEWRYSALSEPFLSADKLFEVSPVTWEDKKGADQNDTVINSQFRTKIKRVKFIDEYVRTTVDEGTCYVRPGWKRESVIQKVTVPVWNYFEDASEENIARLNEAITLMAENPRGYEELPEEVKAAVDYAIETQIPVIAEQGGTEQVDEETVLKNHPTLEIVNFENVYLDPNCDGDVDKANFAIISFETSKAQLLKDGRYKNLDKINWSSNSPLAEPEHSSSGDSTVQFRDDLRKRIIAYEYWGFYDVKGNDTLVPIVATWIGQTMIRMEENPYPDQKIPLVLVPYLPVKRSPTGEPDAELLEDNQAILGAVTRGMIDLLGRSANGQTGHAKGMLDTVNRRRYDRGQDYEFNPQMPPAMGLYQHTYPEIPNSALTMLQLQNQEAESITGVKAFSGGLSGEAFGDVAAAVRGVLDASSKREMSILRRLAEGMEQIGRKIISMNQVFLSEEEVVRITNDEFVTVRREDLAGEFDLKVDITTAEIEEKAAQDLGFLLQTMGPNLPWPLTQMILVEMAKRKKMPALVHGLENYQPEPDPLAEKQKELELLELEAKIQEIQSKIQLNQAKAAAEMAETDKTNLDFLDQESGTKHARDIQKQQAQAESNQLLKVTEAVLAPKEKRPSEKALSEGVELFNIASERV